MPRRIGLGAALAALGVATALPPNMAAALAALGAASSLTPNRGRFHAASRYFTTPAVVRHPARVPPSRTGGSSGRVGRYSVCARRAIEDGELDRARKTYAYYMARFGDDPRVPPSESALVAHRWALLEQRAENATGARAAFKLGARIVTSQLRSCEAAGTGACDPRLRSHGATLFCSWGLAEFRHAAALGASSATARETSLALLAHAAALDERKRPVLRWKRFRDAGRLGRGRCPRVGTST